MRGQHIRLALPCGGCELRCLMAKWRSPAVIAAVEARKDEVVPDILRRLLAGDSMNEICRADGMPDRETVRRWCSQNPALEAEVYAAREDKLPRDRTL